ncbi:MAG: 50S ribosomal protein L6 [Candidatus Hodarchaeales archaeon]
MTHYSIEKTVEVPKDIKVDMKQIRGGYTVKIEGPKGKLEKSFTRLTVNMSFENNTFVISSHFGKKRAAAMVGTITGHLNNMIKGVKELYTYKVQIITSHFPATVEAQKSVILIKNLYGRRDPIKVPYDPSVNIKIKGDMITLTGIDKELVSQAAARLAESSRLRGRRSKDPTVFQDGLYVINT